MRPNQSLQPTALWRCASMSILIVYSHELRSIAPGAVAELVLVRFIRAFIPLAALAIAYSLTTGYHALVSRCRPCFRSHVDNGCSWNS
jgi:hypothetical protein